MDRFKNPTNDPQGDAEQVVKPSSLKSESNIVFPNEAKVIPLDDKEDKKDPKSAIISKLKNLWAKRWFKATLIIVILFSIIIALITSIMFSVISELKVTKSHATETLRALEGRNLKTARDNLALTRSSLDKAYLSFNKSSFLKFVPLVRNYWLDVDHIFKAGQEGIKTGELVFSAIEPYADLLGFDGAESEQEFESAENRIIFVAETIEKLAPEMDMILKSLERINAEVSQINESRYPKKLFGLEIRPQIAEAKNSVNSTISSLSQFMPIIDILPDLLGNPDPTKYLLLFQNDAELRPTGGFLTAYATLTLDKGKIIPGVSEDIYTLDNNFNKIVPAPEPIKKYLPLVYNWNLRDMNLSPDFKVSMDTFSMYYKEVPIAPEVDAIIAIDTEVPVRLLKVLGPIGVPGYGGKFTAEIDERCDCPQVIYELENIITRPTYEIREGRKSILGPLMNSILANIMGSPRSKWPEFLNIFTESIQEKHLLMYFFDAEKQKAVEALQAAGRINDYEGDYLHINDTNFAGAKSNMFVEQEVVQDISIAEDGTITKKIELTYRNPAPPSNCNLEAGQLCLNGMLRDWIRIYVPLGSTLISSTGSEVDVITTEDLGKTVFEGFFTLAPESVKKLEFEYQVPPQGDGDYRLLIQKQPGTKTIKHTITLGDEEQELYVNTDIEVIIPR